MKETKGGSGGVVVCLGVGGMIDLGTTLGFESDDEPLEFGGVEVWVIDSRRPWDLHNVFGGFTLEPEVEASSSLQSRAPEGVVGGCISRSYKPGRGGIVVFDDGDIQEGLSGERDAYLGLLDMPEIEGDDEGAFDDDDSEEEDNEADNDVVNPLPGQKRKSWGDRDDESSDEDDDRPRQRRRSNSVCHCLFREFASYKTNNIYSRPRYLSSVAHLRGD